MKLNAKFAILLCISSISNFGLARVEIRDLVTKSGVNLSKNARQALVDSVIEGGSELRDFEVPEYGRGTLQSLYKIKKDVSARNNKNIGAKHFLSNSIDFLVIPVMDTVSTLPHPATKAIGASGAFVGTLLSAKMKQEMKAFEDEQQARIAGLFEHALLNSQGGALHRDLLEISQINDPSIRAFKTEEYVGHIQETYINKYMEQDEDGQNDSLEARAQVNSMLSKFLTFQIFENKKLINTQGAEFSTRLNHHLGKINKNSYDIDKNSQDIALLGRTFVKANQNYIKAFEAVNVYQKEFTKKMDKSLGVIQGNVSNLMIREFNKMTPAQKIVAVKPGGLLYSSLNQKDRDAVIEQWKDSADFNYFMERASTVINVAQNFVKIGQKLGLDENLLKNIQGAVNLIGPTLNIAAGMTPPYNPMAIMNGVSNLIGGGQSAETVRHAQMMKVLSALMNGQKRILTNQVKIKEDLSKLVRGQVTIFNELSKINEKLDLIDQKLNFVTEEIYVNRSLIMENIHKDFKVCNVVIASLNKAKNRNPRRIVSDYYLEDILRYSSEEILACLSAYEEIYMSSALDSKSFNNVFSIQTNNPSFQSYVRERDIYLPLVTFHAQQEKNYDSLFSKLAMPVNSVQGLRQKNLVKNPNIGSINGYGSSYLSHKVSLEKIQKGFESFSSLLAIFELNATFNELNVDKNLFKLTNILEEMYLASFIPLVQENIISGVNLVTSMYEKRKADNAALENYMGRNKILQKNYISYYINEKIQRKSNLSFLNLSKMLLLLKESDKENIKNFFKDIGYGIQVDILPVNIRLASYVSKIMEMKKTVIKIKPKVMEFLASYDTEVFGEDSELKEGDVKKFFEHAIIKLTKLNTLIESFRASRDRKFLVEIENTILDKKFNELIRKHRVHPHDNSIKRAVMLNIQKIVENYTTFAKEIVSGLEVSEEIWFTTKDGTKFKMPKLIDIMDGKLYRSERFYEAAKLNIQLKNLFYEYNLIKNLSHSDDKEDIQKLIISGSL